MCKCYEPLTPGKDLLPLFNWAIWQSDSFRAYQKLMGDLVVTWAVAGSGPLTSSGMSSIFTWTGWQERDWNFTVCDIFRDCLDWIWLWKKHCADQDNHPSDIDLTPVCSNLFFQITSPAATYHYLTVILQWQLLGSLIFLQWKSVAKPQLTSMVQDCALWILFLSITFSAKMGVCFEPQLSEHQTAISQLSPIIQELAMGHRKGNKYIHRNHTYNAIWCYLD